MPENMKERIIELTSLGWSNKDLASIISIYFEIKSEAKREATDRILNYKLQEHKKSEYLDMIISKLSEEALYYKKAFYNIEIAINENVDPILAIIHTIQELSLDLKIDIEELMNKIIDHASRIKVDPLLGFYLLDGYGAYIGVNTIENRDFYLMLVDNGCNLVEGPDIMNPKTTAIYCTNYCEKINILKSLGINNLDSQNKPKR